MRNVFDALTLFLYKQHNQTHPNQNAGRLEACSFFIYT